MLAEDNRADVTDAWTLLSVVYACEDGRGADLSTIRFIAGLLRHATLADEELRAALGRLQATGLISERGARYHPAEPVLGIFKARIHRRGVREDLENLVRFKSRLQSEFPNASDLHP